MHTDTASVMAVGLGLCMTMVFVAGISYGAGMMANYFLPIISPILVTYTVVLLCFIYACGGCLLKTQEPTGWETIQTYLPPRVPTPHPHPAPETWMREEKVLHSLCSEEEQEEEVDCKWGR
jgi:hypothetical protein